METLNIPIGNTQIIQGDTIPEILFEFDPTDNINLLLPNVQIKMQIYLVNTKIIDISNGNGITILTDKSFRIDEVSKEDNNLPTGKHLGDLEITDTNGKRFTYFRVQYNIEKQYTK
mgnify:FL=1